jgi:hypothetical protein
MEHERIAFFVLENQINDKGEFQALIAVEGKKGYYTTDGSGAQTSLLPKPLPMPGMTEWESQ